MALQVLKNGPSHGRASMLIWILLVLSSCLCCSALRLAAFGDYGWAGPDEQAVANMVNAWRVDDILALGDDNYDMGEASTIDANNQYYTGYMYPYSGSYGSGSPSKTNHFWPVPGNHDWALNCNDGTSSCSGQCSATPGSATANGYIAPYLQYFAGVGGKLYYTTLLGGGLVQLFALDADCSEPDSTTSTSKQGVWLQNQLAASTAPWKVVILHQSPYSSGSDHGSFPRLQWPFQTWGADVVLSGHDHGYERILKTGFPYFVNGAGGASLYAFSTPVAGSTFRYNSNFGAQLITVNTTVATFRFFSVGGADAYSGFQDCYSIKKTGGTTTYSSCTAAGAATEGFNTTTPPAPSPTPQPSPSPSPKPSPSPSPKPSPSPSPTPSPSPSPKPSPSPSPKPSPSPSPKPSPSPSPRPSPSPSPKPSPSPSPKPSPSPSPSPRPSPSPSPKPSPSPSPKLSPSPSPKPSPSPSPSPKLSPSPSPKPSPSPSPKPSSPSPSPSPKASPSPSPAPPTPSPSPSPSSSPCPTGNGPALLPETAPGYSPAPTMSPSPTPAVPSPSPSPRPPSPSPSPTPPPPQSPSPSPAVPPTPSSSPAPGPGPSPAPSPTPSPSPAPPPTPSPSPTLAASPAPGPANASDWADLTDGLAGHTITYGTTGLLVGCVMTLKGSTFPVIMTNDNDHAIMTAARVSAGRAVMFNMEDYFELCDWEPALCNGDSGRLIINSLRWGAKRPAPAAGSRVSFRMAVNQNDYAYTALDTPMFDNFAAYAATIGVDILKPTGQTSWIVNDVTLLGTGASAIADVFLTTTADTWTSTERTAIQNFILSGGGLLIGGEGWSWTDKGNTISSLPGNRLLAPLNILAWTDVYTTADYDPPSVVVGTVPPWMLPPALRSSSSSSAPVAPPPAAAVAAAAAAAGGTSPLQIAPGQHRKMKPAVPPTSSLMVSATELPTAPAALLSADLPTPPPTAAPTALVPPTAPPTPDAGVSPAGLRRLLNKAQSPGERQLRKMQLKRPHSIVPDEAEHQAEKDRISQSVSGGRDRLVKARNNPMPAFNLAMQQATDSGYGHLLKDRQARYNIFLANLRAAEEKNANAGPDEVRTVDKFSVFTQEELRSMRRFPKGPQQGRKMLNDHPSMQLTCACGQSTERPFQYANANVANITATSWRAYMTPPRDQQSSNACGMFAVTATLEAGFYKRWYQLGWTPNNIDLAEEDLIECAAGDQMQEGSWAEESFNPAICSGMPYESTAMLGRPFNLVDNGNCPYSPSATLKRWQTGTWAWTRIPGDLLSIRKALTASPIVMTVDSNSLGNGVGISPATGSTSYDHYIAIVAYFGNVTTPYFLYKNSWGTDWGESGWGRISVNEASFFVADGYQPLYG